MTAKLLISASIIGLLPPYVTAEDGWTGEGAISAGATTGNTDTSDIGLSLTASHTAQIWSLDLEGTVDYAETDEVETKNRLFLAAQLDRQVSDRVFIFGRGSYEVDEFSGFESRSFAGVGFGYDVLIGQTTNWAINGGPGWKIDEIEETRDALTDGITTMGRTESRFSAIGSSSFSHRFNEAVKLTNSTDILYTAETTQVVNIAALNAELMSNFSARISYELRHDTNPQQGFEATDAASRVSLVYGF